MTDPNPTHMLRYCTTIVPDVLTKARDVDGNFAERIGTADSLDRAGPSPTYPPISGRC